MNIFQPDFTPPATLSTDEFSIFPTSLEYYMSDYEAVMKSRDYLRIWSVSDWPSDTFTAEENREDLKLHIDDNQTHSAYGYMIYDREHSKCFGSLYVNPISTILENYLIPSDIEPVLRSSDARIDYWVRSDEREADAQITQMIRNWLTNNWKIKPLFSARSGMDLRIQNYLEAGMQELAKLKSTSSETRLLLFR